MCRTVARPDTFRLAALAACLRRSAWVEVRMPAPVKADLNLGIIGNCVLSALIDRRARFVWCCLPSYDGDPVFCSLMQGGEGADTAGFLDCDVDRLASSDQKYIANTAILSTTLTDSAGQSLEIIDFAPRFKRYERIFRPRLLIRRIEPRAGNCLVRIRFRPCADYGATVPTPQLGSNHIRCSSPSGGIRLTTDVSVAYIAQEQWFVVDRPLTLIVGQDEQVSSPVSGLVNSFLARTTDYWLEWTRYPSVPFERHAAGIPAPTRATLVS